MEARIFEQVVVDDRAQVLVVRNVLGEYHEGNRYIGDSNCGNVFRVDGVQPLEGLNESEFRHPLHGAEGAEVEDLQAVVSDVFADQGEDQGDDVARDDTQDERNQLEHLFTLHGEEDDSEQSDQRADQVDPQGAAHGIGSLRTAKTEGVADGVSGQRQADDGDGRSDDDRGHQFGDPPDTRDLYDDRDDNVNQAGEDGTDDQSGIADGDRGGTAESCEHGTEESEAGSEENGAPELREEQVNDRADAGAEEGRALAHAVSDDAGHRDGRGQNGQQLLQSEDDQLAEFGFVVDLVNKIHGTSSFIFLEGLCKRKSLPA